MWFFVPLENFSLIWRHYHYRRCVANFDLYSVIIIIEVHIDLWYNYIIHYSQTCYRNVSQVLADFLIKLRFGFFTSMYYTCNLKHFVNRNDEAGKVFLEVGNYSLIFIWCWVNQIVIVHVQSCTSDISENKTITVYLMDIFTVSSMK